MLKTAGICDDVEPFAQHARLEQILVVLLGVVGERTFFHFHQKPASNFEVEIAAVTSPPPLPPWVCHRGKKVTTRMACVGCENG